MNPERLLREFHRVAEATDAVPRLRQFILDLAVRGKLVEQREEEGSAEELLREIEEERERLIMKREIKSKTECSKIEPNRMPFAIPRSWAWLALSDLGILSGGMTPSKGRQDFWEGDVHWFSPKDFRDDRLKNSELKITQIAVEETRLQVYPPGAILMVARSGILKRKFPVSITEVHCTVNQDVKVLSPFVVGLERYLQIMFKGMTSYILEHLVKTGTTVQSLKYTEFSLHPFPLPPLAEQHRIVAKVDELMELCDRLEEAKKEREEERRALVAATHHRVNQPEGDTTSPDTLHFVMENFHYLATRPEHVAELRKTILNLAVRGKLVEQREEEGSAEELLKRMKDMEEIQRKTIVNHSHSIRVPFSTLPKNWKWISLVEAGITQTGNTPPKSHPEYYGSDMPFVKPADLNGSEVNYSGEGISKKGLPFARLIKGHSILMVCIGSTIGKVNSIDRDVCCNQQINALTPFIIETKDFLKYALKADFFKDQINAVAGTGTLPIISKGKWEKLIIPLPPLTEQHRIVAKVDELMELCDRLESALREGEKVEGALLESLLHEALSGENLVESEQLSFL